MFRTVVQVSGPRRAADIGEDLFVLEHLVFDVVADLGCTEHTFTVNIVAGGDWAEPASSACLPTLPEALDLLERNLRDLHMQSIPMRTFLPKKRGRRR
jgi:hypothetical protein